MRIISQDGTLDIPYEMVVILRYEDRIYFLNANLTGVKKIIDDMQLAEYSSFEKARKAMGMLQEAYAEGEDKYFRFPHDGEVEVLK